jgi:hypothetical protein
MASQEKALCVLCGSHLANRYSLRSHQLRKKPCIRKITPSAHGVNSSGVWDAILKHVLQTLEPHDQAMAAQVCKKWYQGLMIIPRKLRIEFFTNSKSRLKWALKNHCDKVWAKKYNSPGKKLLCAYAAKHGNLAVLQWLRLKKHPWDERTCSYAAMGGSVEALKYAHDTGCPCNKDECLWIARTLLIRSLIFLRNRFSQERGRQVKTTPSNMLHNVNRQGADYGKINDSLEELKNALTSKNDINHIELTKKYAIILMWISDHPENLRFVYYPTVALRKQINAINYTKIESFKS